MSELTGPSLDDEGIPDLVGPLPEKERTGDPQEGVMPPGDRAHAETDWGITGEEQRIGEPLDVRVAHELPDIGETDPVDEVARDLGLDGGSDELGDPADPVALGESESLRGKALLGDDLVDDEEAEVLALDVEADPMGAQSAEEAALRIVDDSTI